jgi:hypothetical protein
MRRYGRTDENHSDVVATFRRLGCSVQSLAPIGHGVPDLLVADRWGTFLVEIKDGAKSPSQRKLTPDQETFHATWLGTIYIVETLDDVAAVIIKAARDARAG